MENLYYGKCVCIDWDIFFDTFLKMAKNHTFALIKVVEERMNMKAEVFYQASAGGNVHIALRFPRSITVLDGFCIRAYLADDQQRLRLDLARYLKNNSDLHEINRCFTSKIKIKNGQAVLSSAGPWIRFEETELPAITTQEAHALISNLQKERRKAHADPVST